MGERQYVDFHQIPPEHRGVDARLANWARWCRGGAPGLGAAPMWRLYRPTRQWAPSPTYGLGGPDVRDALLVQRALGAVPERGRLALGWFYVRRNNPRRAALELGESLEGLARLVHAARDSLLARLCSLERT